jgi:hypothetical protein
VLVVVVAVDRVQVLPVSEVGMASVDRGRMAAAGAMDVHVAGVRDMDAGHRRGPVVDVVAIGVMEVPIVEEVEMIVMGHLGVPAPAVVGVIMRVVRTVRPVPGDAPSVWGHVRRPWWHGVADTAVSLIVALRSWGAGHPMGSGTR